MPAEKLALSWINHADAPNSVLTASGEAAPVANLVQPIVGRRWRTASLTGWAQVDLLANKSIGVLALRFPRDTAFPTSGSVRWQLDADGGTAGTGAAHDQTVSIGAVEGYGYHVHMPSATQTARYVRFTFSGVSGLSFIDVGRLWVGEAWRPDFNMALGYEDEWSDLTQVSGSSRSGAEFVDSRARQRQYAFGLEALSESDRDDLREMQRIAGVGQQVLFVKDPSAPAKETILGRLSRTQPIRHREIPIYATAFALRESL